MNVEIKRRFDALETRRKAFVERVRALPPDKQKAHPDSKFFSPVEVVKHFALAENGNLQFLRNNPPATLQGQKPHLRFVYHKVLSTMQQAKRTGTVSYMVPDKGVTLEDGERSWEAARAELAGFLEPVDSQDDPFCKFMFLFGMGSANDYLALMEAHMHYHETLFPA